MSPCRWDRTLVATDPAGRPAGPDPEPDWGNREAMLARRADAERPHAESSALTSRKSVAQSRFVVRELKTGRFQPECTGQLGFYLACVDANLRDPDRHSPTIGTLLCAGRNDNVRRWPWVGEALPGGLAGDAQSNRDLVPRPAVCTSGLHGFTQSHLVGANGVRGDGDLVGRNRRNFGRRNIAGMTTGSSPFRSRSAGQPRSISEPPAITVPRRTGRPPHGCCIPLLPRQA